MSEIWEIFGETNQLKWWCTLDTRTKRWIDFVAILTSRSSTGLERGLWYCNIVLSGGLSLARDNYLISGCHYLLCVRLSGSSLADCSGYGQICIWYGYWVRTNIPQGKSIMVLGTGSVTRVVELVPYFPANTTTLFK